MTPVAVFVRTLLKSTAIFIGTAAIFLHPQLEFRASSNTNVGAGQAPREAMVDALVVALKDSDAGVRRQAARTLAQIGNPRAVPALSAAMKDAEPDMRAIIASALGELGDAAAVPALRDALKDENVAVRVRAASALGEIGDRSAVDALIAAA